MSILYTLSNILIPYSLMVFQTLKKSNEGQKISYGKWLVLFLLTFIFNGLSIWGRWWILLIDLALKCSLYFLPEQINQRIETQINRLHLEGLIQNLRNRLVNNIFIAHQKTTIYLLSKLRNQQSEQFKQAYIKSLNNQTKSLSAEITVQPKFFESTAINCTIITQDAVQKSLIKRELQQKRGDIQKRISPDSKGSDSSKKMKPQKEFAKQMLIKPYTAKQYQNQPTNMYKSQPVGFGSKTDGVSSKLKDSFGEIRQSSNIIVDDFEELQPSNPPPVRFSRHVNSVTAQHKVADKPKSKNKQAEKPVLDKNKEQVKMNQVQNKQTIAQKKNGQRIETRLKRGLTEISQVKNIQIKQARRMSISPQAAQQVNMIEKLDVSVSEYSDMFQDDRDQQINSQRVEQVCRVQAIVQIGVPPQSKLQIYYLELYSNGDLRIMSLYNREFQKHKLISMTKGQNNYYELHFVQGKVNKRKIKFRGEYGPFMNHLQKN